MLTPRKQPRQHRSRETVAVILEAAAQLFQRYGYAGTTTNKIAERAGVSIGSLYQYFPNKDALLVALAEHHLAQSGEQVAQVLARAAERRPSLLELLTGLVRCVADLHTDRPALHRLLFDQAPALPAWSPASGRPSSGSPTRWPASCAGSEPVAPIPSSAGCWPFRASRRTCTAPCSTRPPAATAPRT
ncbi:TetR/AcrR family transcriptional regulator [Nonomuraea thailandensis]